MIAFRSQYSVLARESFYTDADVGWCSPEGSFPNWSNPQERRLACHILGGEEPDLFLMFNAGTGTETFSLPAPSQSGEWALAACTSNPSPRDLAEPGHEMDLEEQESFQLGPQASALLVSRPQS